MRLIYNGREIQRHWHWFKWTYISAAGVPLWNEAHSGFGDGAHNAQQLANAFSWLTVT